MGGTVRGQKTNSQHGINDYISRTHTFSKGTELKSPRVIRGALSTTTGPTGFSKRDMTRTNVLDPIKISEEANTDNQPASPVQEESQLSKSGSK